MRQVLSLSGHIFPSLIPHTHAFSPSSGSLLDKSAESPAEVLWWQVVSATDDRLYKHISHAGCYIPGQTQHTFDMERDCTHLSRGCVKNCVRFKNDRSFWYIHPCHNVSFGRAVSGRPLKNKNGEKDLPWMSCSIMAVNTNTTRRVVGADCQ